MNTTKTDNIDSEKKMQQQLPGKSLEKNDSVKEKKALSRKKNKIPKHKKMAPGEVQKDLEDNLEKIFDEAGNEIIQRKWLQPDGGKVLNDSFILEWIKKSKEDKDNELEYIIGTDSHLHKYNFKFITVFCIRKVGKGAMYYYLKKFEQRDMFKNNQRGRMFFEADLSIEVAEWIKNQTGIISEIHLDVSPKHKKKFTSTFSDQLKAYVESFGFPVKIKHESSIASSVADRHSK